MSGDVRIGTQTGDRTSFLARVKAGQVESPPHNLAHPLPEPQQSIPLVVSKMLDPSDLVASFCANARAVNATVTQIGALADLPASLAAIVDRHAAVTAVASGQPLAATAADSLRGLGLQVAPISAAASAQADLGVTVACGAIATTGSIVQRSDEVGGRTGSLLCRVHVAIVPVDQIVATSADVLRRLSDSTMPSNITIITGPSKSGDIEQILVTGVHGPLAIEIIVIG